MTGDDPRTLTRLLDAVDEAGGGEVVSVQDILDEIGEQSIMPIVLIVSILLVSPLSGIPGMPTLSSLILLTLILQAAVGRKQLWLPPFLRNRRVRAERLHLATGWLRRPAAWIDRHSHPRLRILTRHPLRLVTLMLCMAMPLQWPFLEFFPFVTSFGAGALALMAFGLLTHDGMYVLAGHIAVAAQVLAVLWLAQAAA
ncbi:exopolysaccharide biosynthesis protein [uncultured Tateyamaria sp.]|uniref:exopolysaccharide biosynthesis protein n=1 Tax=uncultured Tateyamaria sp. TaxID=455651 RepID=UPI0026294713|nr:exopolysaccharide biosynthesis protein [uncultured Tateyamaria sp.]